MHLCIYIFIVQTLKNVISSFLSIINYTICMFNFFTHIIYYIVIFFNNLFLVRKLKKCALILDVDIFVLQLYNEIFS